MSTIIKLSDFTRFPGGRYRSDGPSSGQEFREKLLAPALRQSDVLIVSLDGVAGLPASFLEEAFGGLVRLGFSSSDLQRRLKLAVTDARLRRYPAMIWDFIATAQPTRAVG